MDYITGGGEGVRSVCGEGVNNGSRGGGGPGGGGAGGPLRAWCVPLPVEGAARAGPRWVPAVMRVTPVGGEGQV